jgi:hypothetical protein
MFTAAATPPPFMPWHVLHLSSKISLPSGAAVGVGAGVGVIVGVGIGIAACWQKAIGDAIGMRKKMPMSKKVSFAHPGVCVEFPICLVVLTSRSVKLVLVSREFLAAL